MLRGYCIFMKPNKKSQLNPLYLMSLLKQIFSDEVSKTAFYQYKSFYLKSKILEAIAVNEISVGEDILRHIVNDAQKNQTMLWSITVPDIQIETNYLIKMGFIYKTTKGIYSITESGKSAFKNELYSSLYTNTFFGYNSLLISKNSMYIAILALIVSIISIIISLK